ncbi:hypothetical protein HMPREF9404_3270 [Eggerthella sp. HGA1]|nr:hypothetical protein HMPREF9404_3270 [Eggerthella sp. HGA1]
MAGIVKCDCIGRVSCEKQPENLVFTIELQPGILDMQEEGLLTSRKVSGAFCAFRFRKARGSWS